MDEGVDGVFVVSVHLGGVAVGDDHAAGHGSVTKEGGETCKGRTFHLEVADFQPFIFKSLDFLVLLWDLNLQADLATLRTIETTASNGDASHHVVSCYLVNQFWICLCHVGGTFHGRPIHVLLEGFFHWQVANLVAVSIVVEQAIEANALDGGDETTRGGERLQATTSADTHDGEGAVFILLSASVEVDVGKGIQFGHHNVDIVAADARGEHGDAFALISSCNAMELAAAHFAFLLREV